MVPMVGGGAVASSDLWNNKGRAGFLIITESVISARETPTRKEAVNVEKKKWEEWKCVCWFKPDVTERSTTWHQRLHECSFVSDFTFTTRQPRNWTFVQREAFDLSLGTSRTLWTLMVHSGFVHGGLCGLRLVCACVFTSDNMWLTSYD